MKTTRLTLMNSDPWLKHLNSGHDDGNRIERFMEKESKISEARVRIVGFAGEPGDVVIGHPWLLHSTATKSLVSCCCSESVLSRTHRV